MDDPSIGAYDNPTGRSGKGPAECEWPGRDLPCDLPRPLLAALAVSAACCRGPYLQPSDAFWPALPSSSSVKSTCHRRVKHRLCPCMVFWHPKSFSSQGVSWGDASESARTLHCSLVPSEVTWIGLQHVAGIMSQITGLRCNLSTFQIITTILAPLQLWRAG